MSTTPPAHTTAPSPAPVATATPTPKTEAPEDPNVIYAMSLEGPHPSRGEACSHALATADCNTLKILHQAPKPEGPYLEIAIGESKDTEKKANLQFFLFLRTKKGWFGTHLGTRGSELMRVFPHRGADGESYGGGTMQRQRYFIVPTITALASTPASVDVVLRYDNPDGGFHDQAKNAEQVQVCSIGPSGEPSCTDTLFLSSPSRKKVGNLRELFFGKPGERRVDSLGTDDDQLHTKTLQFY